MRCQLLGRSVRTGMDGMDGMDGMGGIPSCLLLSALADFTFYHSALYASAVSDLVRRWPS